MSNTNKNFSMIYYYIPEDLDDPEIPNVFGINLPQEEIKVSNIKSNFPLEGDYHFRFKCKYNNSIVWLDVENEDSKLPLFNGRLFTKATRISWNIPNQAAKEKNEMKNVNNVQENNNVNYLNINPQHQQQPKQPEYNLNWMKAPNGNNSTSKANKNESDLLDFDNLDLRSETKMNPTTNPKKKNEDLIDF